MRLTRMEFGDLVANDTIPAMVFLGIAKQSGRVEDTAGSYGIEKGWLLFLVLEGSTEEPELRGLGATFLPTDDFGPYPGKEV